MYFHYRTMQLSYLLNARGNSEKQSSIEVKSPLHDD